MKPKKYVTALFIVAVLLCTLNVTAFAHDVPDLTKEGAISITMKYQGKAVSGGMLTLYRVGDVHEEDGNYDFILNSDFAGSGVALSALSSAELPDTLAQYAEKQKLPGITQDIGSDGKVSFQNVSPGLYLIVQNKAAEGYNKAESFLVSLPYMENGSYVYNVDASPKVELEKEPAKPVTPSKPDPSLPQTGQLNWPIPVLIIAGLLLFSVGWALRFRKRSTGYEN